MGLTGAVLHIATSTSILAGDLGLVSAAEGIALPPFYLAANRISAAGVERWCYAPQVAMSRCGSQERQDTDRPMDYWQDR